MEQAEALFEYWEKNPPTHVILAARYLPGLAKKTTARAKAVELTEEQALDEMRTTAEILDKTSVEEMPQQLRDDMVWAEGKKQQMKAVQ